jgi:proline iminopeptidase
MLDVGDRHQVYWEASGDYEGCPVLFLHGGPGSGLGTGYRTYVDLEQCMLVGFDQRGCGRSRPLAADDLTSLATNTTAHLIADIEALREHLNIERWLVAGVSWGTTLATAYTLAHPDRVVSVVFAAVATVAGIEWITETVGAVFPKEWDAFERASGRTSRQRVVEGYYDRLTSDDVAVRQQASAAWCAWEGVHISLDPRVDGRPLFDGDPLRQAAFATMVVHYWKHNCWIDHAEFIHGVRQLSNVPAVLIHGRLDVSGPLGLAWELHRAWSNSELHVIESEGHGGSTMMTLFTDAVARLSS